MVWLRRVSCSAIQPGRTATHEIGHWLGLKHVWGDDGNSCAGSDGVADTPNQAGPTYGCLSYPATDACSPNPPGIMFMNYMDYSDDTCMYMFTQGRPISCGLFWKMKGRLWLPVLWW